MDGCFFEIYFEEEMLKNNLTIRNIVKNELQVAQLTKDYESEKLGDMHRRIKVFYNNMKIGEVQKRMRMFPVKSPKILKPILES